MTFKSVVVRFATTVLFVAAIASCGGSDSGARTRNGMVNQKNINTINSCSNTNNIISNLNSNNMCNIDNCITTNNIITNLNSNIICNIDDNVTNNNVIINITTTTVDFANVPSTTLRANGDDVAQQNSVTTTSVSTTSSVVASNNISNSIAACSITVTSTRLSACKAISKVTYRMKRGNTTVASGTKAVDPAAKSLAYSKKPTKSPTTGTLTISFEDGTSASVSLNTLDGKAITVYPK